MKIQTILTVVVIILFPCLLWKTCSYLRSDYLRLIKEGKRTVGIVTHVSSHVGLKYEVDGVEYGTSSQKPYRNIESGEQFEVAYDISKPSHSTALFFRPVIIEGNFGRTKSIDITDLNGSSNIEFSYTVNEKTYYNYASIPEFFDEKIDIYNNRIFLVKYNKNRPHVAYIYLDSLIAE
jgi:hypothetical protein